MMDLPTSDALLLRAPEPLVGRDRELARIAECLEALGTGPARVLVLSGEAGIGKTALLAEVAHRADTAGHRVLRGTGVEFEADIPFVVVAEALGGHADPMDRPIAGGAPLLAAERYRTYRAVGGALEALAAERPLVLCLDDLQWADPASIELVAHLLRRRPHGPILLALAMRPAQAPAPLAAAVHRATREGDCQELHLRPLDQEACDRLLGPGIPGERRRELEALSGGNPFFLRQLSRTPGGEAVVAGNGADDDIPPAVRAAVAEELRRLPSRSLRALEGAAVAGDPFSLELAAAAGDLSEGDARSALDDLAAADLVRLDGGPRLMRFRHPIIRNAVYAASAPAWRVGAHARAAELLIGRGGEVQACAHHLERSAAPGDVAAAAVIERAGRDALRTAPAAAARWLEAARRLLPATPEHAERSLELLVLAAGAHGDGGRLGRCADLLVEALELLPREAVDMHVRLTTACASVERLLGRYEAADARLLDALPGVDGADLRAAAALRTELAAVCLFQTGGFDPSRGRAWAERALADAQDAGDEPLICTAATVMAHVELAEGRTADANGHRERAGAVLDGLGDDGLAAALTGCFYLVWVEVFLERFDDALRHVRRGLATARASGQGQLLAPMLISEAGVLSATGRLGEAEAISEAAVEAGRMSGNPQLLSWALGKQCFVRTLAGDLGAARRAGEEALEVARRHDVGTLTAAIAWAQASALLEDGEAERAAALILEAVGGPELPMIYPCVRPFCLELLARSELAQGRVDGADAWARRAEDLAAGLGLDRRRAQALRARAAVAMESGEADVALRSANASEEAAARVGARLDVARAALMAGRALAVLGRREEAIARLAGAEAEFAECGAIRFRDEAARELRRLGHRVRRTGARPTGSGLSVLSERERQIAELVSEGRRNREIAERLFLSERTVEDNLARIRAKLGVSSRAAIGAAIERGRRAAE